MHMMDSHQGIGLDGNLRTSRVESSRNHSRRSSSLAPSWSVTECRRSFREDP